jgi:hypothetical protein
MATGLREFIANDNMLIGPLGMPAANCSLTTFQVQSNLFSCPINVGAPCPHGRFFLAAPGNRFQANPASWPFDPIVGASFDSMRSVAFMWVGTLWQTWRWSLLGCMLGFVALFTTVATTGVIFLPEQPPLRVNLLHAVRPVQRGFPAMRTRLRRFVRFDPHLGVGVAQLWCARELAWLAVPCIATIALLNCLNCFVGAPLYTCGEWVTKYLTIAYVHDPAGEWALAVATCAFPCATVRLVLRFQKMLQAEYTPQPQPPPVASSAAIVCMYVQWAILIVICTLVPFAYAVSTSLPAEVLGASVQTLIAETTSLVLLILTTAVVSWHCRYVSHRVYGAGGNPLLTSRLMQFARLWISILAPALALVLVHEDCLGGWVLLWHECDSITGHLFSCGGRGSISPGRCSRAVIENLERLLLSKLAYAAFLLPAGVLLQHTPFWRRAKHAVVRCFKPAYMTAYEVDSEFAAVLM